MQRIFRVLQDCYHLTADNVWLIPSGMLNCNYKVQTAEGTYVLKQYRAELYTLEDIQRACAVQDYVLQQATVPTARLIPNIDGRFVTRHDNDTYVLSEFVEGRQYRRGEIPDQAAYEMGRALGQLHLIMSRVPDIKPYRWKTAEEVLPRLESLLRAAEARSRTSTVDANAAQVLRYKIEILSTWNGRPSTWEGQPSQWVHGDFQETNVLFSHGDHVVAILDFDNVRCCPRSLEVVRAFSLGFKTQQGILPQGYTFIRGYFTEVRPSKDEVEQFIESYWYDSLTKDWPIGVRYLSPEKYQDRWDTFIQPPNRWWEHHANEVTNTLLRILQEEKGAMWEWRN